MTDSKHEILKKDSSPLMEFIAKNYPGMTPKDVLTGPMAEEILGPIPPWSGRKKYQANDCTGVYPGNCAVIYGEDDSWKSSSDKSEPFIVYQKRSENGVNGEVQYGLLGGFATVDDNPERNLKKEQPREGCKREIMEESVDDKGVSILSPDTKRFKLLDAGYDYSVEPPNSYNVFALKMTKQERDNIRNHAERMASDPDYAKAVTDASHGEVKQIFVKPLSEVLKLGRDSFTHPHEFDAIQKFAEQLKVQTRLRQRGE